MTRQLERGEGNVSAFFIIAFLLLVMLVTPKGPQTGKTQGGFADFFSSPAEIASPRVASGPTIGASAGASSTSYPSIYIGMGNAAYEIQPYREYVTIENWGDAPVDLTGWTLRNGKDRRSYELGGQLQRFSADIAAIPQGAPLLTGTGGPLQDIILGRGEEAIVTTGSVPVTSPYRITSFKENECTGYLGRLDDYSFEPPLSSSCPSPADEPGVENLDTACRLAVESISPCTTPTFDRQDANGESCDTCLNGQRLSSLCAAFIEKHFSYQGCLAYHAADPGFANGTTWRIFLGRSWEMWAENYETIELFDRQGNLAAYQNYR